MMSWLNAFKASFAYDLNKDKQQRYINHMGYIKLLITFAACLAVLIRFVSTPNNLVAHYILTDANGIPVIEQDLTAQRPEEEIKSFAKNVARKTFNLDSYGNYRHYRNQLNYVNTQYYRLSWGYLNLTKREFDTGVIVDGDDKYYLVGQELAAVIIKSGIFRMLNEKERKFWIEIEDAAVAIVNSDICYEECNFPTRFWDVSMQAKLFMIELDNSVFIPRFLPFNLKLRVSSASVTESPNDQFMVERLSAIIQRGQQ